MGQKINPVGFRIGVTKPWQSTWYGERNLAELLADDLKVRKFLKKELYQAGVSKIEVQQNISRVNITVHAARPGLAIGRKGAGIESLKADVAKLLGKNKDSLGLDIVEVRKAETDAQLISEAITQQLERRVSYRRAMKKAIQQAMKFGVKGIKVRVSGRLGGTDIARSDKYSEGSVPLHTLRADIDYGFAEALTTYGIIGVRVWVYKGEIDMRTRLGRGARQAGTNPGLAL